MCIIQEPLNTYKIQMFHIKDSHKTYQNQNGFGQIDRFLPNFFSEIRAGRAQFCLFRPFKLQYQSKIKIFC